MLMKNLLLLIFLVLTTLVHAQEIDKKHLVNNWKILKIGEVEMPSDLTMIIKISDSTITMGTSTYVSSWLYKCTDNNLVLIAEGKEESWKIIKLNDREFIFSENSTGLFYLERTEEDLPAIVAPEENYPVEAPEVEPRELRSIESDYKASKKTTKLLIGLWDVESVDGIKAPEGASLSVDFKKDSKITLVANGQAIEKGSWKLGNDGKKIEVTNPDDGTMEIWGIKILDKNNFVMLDVYSGEIVLKKAKKGKK